MWKGICLNIWNVYAPCSVESMRGLWKELVERRVKSGNGEWFLGRDFNEVSSREEILGEGGYQSRRGMEEFQEFIKRMWVVDVPCVGGKFSCFKDNEKAMSRLSRFLSSKNLIDVWGVVDQRIRCRDISDHAPIRLNSGLVDWGPNPFRFNNAWFKHGEFKDFIHEE